MRDLSERDEIREKHADRPGVGHHVERLMGERENAEAYGQDERVAQLDEQLGGFGHTAGAKRKAAAEKQAAETGGEKAAARKQVPQERKAPAGRQSTAGPEKG